MGTLKEYSYIEVAEAQLNSAIDLYVSGDYIPAITLAGAAEELFGGPFAPADHALDSDPRAHAQDARGFALVYRHFFGEDHPAPCVPMNQEKNAMKHYNSASPSRTFDAEDEAYWMLDRAFNNRMLKNTEHNLGRGPHPRMAEVDSKHRAHVLDAARSGRFD